MGWVCWSFEGVKSPKGGGFLGLALGESLKILCSLGSSRFVLVVSNGKSDVKCEYKLDEEFEYWLEDNFRRN